MPLTRRHLLTMAGTAVAATTMTGLGYASTPPSAPIKAILFDGFPIFDPRPIAQAAIQISPDKGEAFWNTWRSRLFEYQWLRALASQYVDFLQAANDGLSFAAKTHDIQVTQRQREELMSRFTNLTVWPDAPLNLKKLHEAGFRLGFISNMTEQMLNSGLKAAGLDMLFEHVLSADRIQTYKPAPVAYQLGVDAYELSREEILFVPFAGWDLAGAEWFGYRTFWVNRLNSPLEELDAVPDGQGSDLSALVDFVT